MENNDLITKLVGYDQKRMPCSHEVLVDKVICGMTRININTKLSKRE